MNHKICTGLLWMVTVSVAATWAGETAAAQDQDWVAAKFVSSGVGPDAVATFESLLHEELRTQLKIPLRPSKEREGCDNPACAQDIAGRTGASHVVYGSVRALGSDILVRVGLYEISSGQILGSDKMTVDRIEDLALVAERIARGFQEGGPAKGNAILGDVVHREVEPPRRREGDHGAALTVAGMIPFGDSYAGADFGMGLALSYWYETLNFVIHPSFGCRFSTNRDPKEGGVFTEVPVEVSAYYVFLPTDISPFLGGSVGAWYGWEKATATTKAPTSVLSETTVERIERDGFGFGVKVRVGALFLRTYTMRLAVWVDYGIGYQDQIHTNIPQSLSLGVGAIF